MNAEDALFNREAQRQAKRIELNWKRIDEGKNELPDPETIEMFIEREKNILAKRGKIEPYERVEWCPDPQEAKRLLQSLGLWPETTKRNGGIWCNSPAYCAVVPPRGSNHPSIPYATQKQWLLERAGL